MLLRRLRSISGLATLLLISSCQDMGVDVMEGGPGIIVPGKSVEGIRLGDSKETVEAILGTPTSVGDAFGAYRGWRLYSYEEERGKPRLEFYFIDNGTSYGPLDCISIGPAYRGKTKEGIGIGSPLSKVHGVYGVPDTAFFLPDQHIIADFYCINEKKFEIHYKDSVISVCSIGYFIPMPEDPFNPCK